MVQKTFALSPFQHAAIGGAQIHGTQVMLAGQDVGQKKVAHTFRIQRLDWPGGRQAPCQHLQVAKELVDLLVGTIQDGGGQLVSRQQGMPAQKNLADEQGGSQEDRRRQRDEQDEFLANAESLHGPPLGTPPRPGSMVGARRGFVKVNVPCGGGDRAVAWH